MTNDLEKFKLEERIYLSCAKHRGNAEKVATELKLPYDFTVKVCEKIRKRQDRDVNQLICGHIMGAIMIGRESRIQYYTIMLEALEGRDSVEVSTCCNAILVTKAGTSDVVCLKCTKPASSYIMHQSEVYRTRMELLSELRKEDIAMVDFSSTMGYTQKHDAPMVYKDSRQYLILGGNDNRQQNIHNGITEKEKILLEEAGKLNPIEVTELINKIQTEELERQNKLDAGEDTSDGSPPKQV